MISKKRVLGIFIGAYLFAYLLALLSLFVSGGKIDIQFVLDSILFFPATLPYVISMIVYGGVGGDLIVLIIMAIIGWVILLSFLILGLIFRKPKHFKTWIAGYFLVLLISVGGVIFLY